MIRQFEVKINSFVGISALLFIAFPALQTRRGHCTSA